MAVAARLTRTSLRFAVALTCAVMAVPSFAHEWLYSDSVDKMTSAPTKTAYSFSVNKAEFTNLFKQEVFGNIGLTERNGKRTAVFWIEQGIILCEPNCGVLVRFGEAPPMTFMVNRFRIDKPGLFAFHEPEKFIAGAQTAKRVLIQVMLYGGGTQVFEFQFKEPLRWESAVAKVAPAEAVPAKVPAKPRQRPASKPEPELQLLN